MQFSANGNAGSADKLASAGRALRLRIFSAAILVTAALLATLMGGLAFLALVLIFAVLVHREWFRVQEAVPYRGAAALLLACWVAAIAWHLVDPQTGILTAMIGGVIGGIIAIVCGYRPLMVVGGYLYIAVPALVFLQLREPGVELLIFLFLVVWLTDTGAYVAGRTIGGPKLWPSVSPNKTWSGAIGGMIAGCLAGGLAAWSWGLTTDAIVHAILVGAIVSVAGQIGDLAESAWKRHFNVKDSGGIIPGHGGVMDRLDSLIVAAPVLALVQAAGGATF